MKIGRNAPCLCGSGKKYKKCCLYKSNVSLELLWRRLGETHDRLVDLLMKYAFEIYGEFALTEAALEFLLWPDEDTFEENLENHGPLFFPWFLFNWVYDPEETEIQLNGPTETTVAELYAEQRRHLLDPLEAQLIETTSRQPYSFYEVKECQPGREYRLQDVFRGEVFDVLEKMGSENARMGDILFGRVIRIDQMAMLIGCGTVLIPPQFKPEMIEFRKWLRKDNKTITAEILTEYDTEIRELYFDIYNVMIRPPELRNTDGDLLKFHAIRYHIDSPELAFKRLHSLSVIETEEKLKNQADFDKAGRIHRVTIPWSRRGSKKSKALENTILGRLEIDGRHLKVEVNSAERAKTIRNEIDKRLGKNAKYLTTEIQSPEAMLAARTESKVRGSEEGMGQNELMQIPEVRELMAKVLSDHWHGWIDEKIPALGGRTPRQAVKTPDGRESVEALLLDAERHMTKDEQMREIGPAAIEDVRKRLGLNKSAATKAKRAPGGTPTERLGIIKRMIEDFGKVKLNEAYTSMALALCDKIARMRKLSIHRGRIEIWAAAIIHLIARLNFLFDPENDISITADEVCLFFGTKKTTVSNKAGHIQKACGIRYGDLKFSSPEIADLFRLYETEDGFLVPGFTLNGPKNGRRPQNTSQSAQEEDGADEKKQRLGKDRGKRQTRETSKKGLDDRQLKLFDDD